MNVSERLSGDSRPRPDHFANLDNEKRARTGR